MSDAGTTARVFGTFIQWLQDKTAPVFVIATANNVKELPPELLRKGRFDEIFFVDLPSHDERMEIFGIHIAKRGRDPKKFDLETLARYSEGFSGAEIEQSVVSAMFNVFLMDGGRDIDTDAILIAIRDVIPLSKTSKEQIDSMKDWAATRARPASNQTPRLDKLEATARKSMKEIINGDK
jgi:SpoVK/Ycf46/Vps4 family AAA+-type ATPase